MRYVASILGSASITQGLFWSMQAAKKRQDFEGCVAACAGSRSQLVTGGGVSA